MDTARSTPKDVFMHVLVIVTLTMSVVSFIALLFQYITVLLPDPLNYFPETAFTGIRWSTSVLIVAFPLYLWLSYLLEKDFAVTPAKRGMAIRRWLVYLTLFIAAITIITDLIVLIYNFYGGDLTTAFLLKILVVLATAGLVFGYYFWDLRRTTKSSALPKQLAVATAAVVLIAIIAGFFLAGSPAQQRRVRFDEQRVNDLQTMQSQIVNFWQQKGQLPATLADLTDSISGFTAPLDPATNQTYTYHKKSDLMFDLCADFKTTGDGGQTNRALPAGDLASSTWQHGVGQTCFARTIDPDLYRPQPKK